uniref:Uncharacterized protein n=1 Tax=Bombyx mori TaxID=7091 RepID=A0A8R2M0I8_BOMMO|nr:uncharacterized protein LOC119629289 [Bombyx mori]
MHYFYTTDIIIHLRILSILTTIGVNLSLMPIIVIFELMWRAVKALRKSLGEHLKGPVLIEGRERLKAQQILRCLNVYKDLNATLKFNSTPMKTMILISTLATFIRLTLFLYQAILGHNEGLHLPRKILAIIYYALPVCLLGVLMELVARECDKLKTLMTKELLVCKDDSYCTVIVDAVSYIELNPLKFSILRAFNVNSTLILGLTNLCTTYLIAVIQFTYSCEDINGLSHSHSH